MSDETYDPAAWRWVKDHSGVISAIGLIACGAAGVVAEIVGALVGADLNDNGWAVTVSAAVVGGLLRIGYHMGRKSRPSRIERQLTQLTETTEDIRGMLGGSSKVLRLQRRDEDASQPRNS